MTLLNQRTDHPPAGGDGDQDLDAGAQYAKTACRTSNPEGP